MRHADTATGTAEWYQDRVGAAAVAAAVGAPRAAQVREALGAALAAERG